MFLLPIAPVVVAIATSAHAGAAAAASPNPSNAAIGNTFNTDINSYSFDDSSYNYCHPGYPSGESYSAVPNATLEFVQLVVRHGDRTPVHLIPREDVTWNCGGVEEDIYLHGAQQPEKNTTGSFQQIIEIPKWNSRYGYSNQVWKGTCDVGELTDRGKAQHHFLGTQLRSIYVDKLKFLPGELSSADPVYVRTTSVWRTKNSAESLIGGLWPNRGYGPEAAIPMHTYPPNIETMYGNTAACPKISEIENTISNASQLQKFLKEQGPLMSRLAGIFGVNGNRWDSSWSGYLDVLLTRQCHEKPLPCRHLPAGAKGEGAECATAEDAAQTTRNANYEWTFKYRDHPLSQNYTRLYIGSFIGTLKDQIQDHIGGKIGGLKFALYSAHDTTVAPLLAVLKASNRNMLWPPYASNLAFELWKKNDGGHVIRVIYNGQTLKLEPGLEWCDLESCPIETFNKYVDDYIPHDVSAECAASN
ncbi:phosphoglycerate mutase-like protein [Martensiomyces pterosporus]|nr:phosphoglycerate mutase-like protein [Martensiomyces pterosporus]